MLDSGEIMNNEIEGRPKHVEFAMQYLRGPEGAAIRTYIETLERLVEDLEKSRCEE